MRKVGYTPKSCSLDNYRCGPVESLDRIVISVWLVKFIGDRALLTFGFFLGYKGVMETEVDEEVKVWAFFDPSSRSSSGQVGIFPIAMSWNRRFVKFEKLIFSSSKKVGDVRLVDLVCASNTSNFEL